MRNFIGVVFFTFELVWFYHTVGVMFLENLPSELETWKLGPKLRL